MALTKQQLLDLINTNLGTTTTITAQEHREVEIAIVDLVFEDRPLIGDIKEIALSSASAGAYISNNFDVTGTFQSNPNYGKGLAGKERYGWAICNGKNGTINKSGRVSVGYDPVAYPVGATGGSATHTLTINEMPKHSHDLPADSIANAGNRQSLVNTANSDEGFNGSHPSADSGGGQPHNNMQPYIVTLFIQKIPV